MSLRRVKAANIRSPSPTSHRQGGYGLANSPDNVNISEASRAVGRSPDTLRRWEEQGLIDPERDARGRRVYRDHHVARCLEIASHSLNAMSSNTKLVSVVPTQLSLFERRHG